MKSKIFTPSGAELLVWLAPFAARRVRAVVRLVRLRLRGNLSRPAEPRGRGRPGPAPVRPPGPPLPAPPDDGFYPDGWAVPGTTGSAFPRGDLTVGHSDRPRRGIGPPPGGRTRRLLRVRADVLARRGRGRPGLELARPFSVSGTRGDQRPVCSGDCPRRHNLLVNVSPGSSKSLLFSVFFPAWVLARDPKKKLILRVLHRGTGPRTVREIAAGVVKSDLYRQLFPFSALSDDSQHENRTGRPPGAGAVGAVGVGGHDHGVSRRLFDRGRPDQPVLGGERGGTRQVEPLDEPHAPFPGQGQGRRPHDRRDAEAQGERPGRRDAPQGRERGRPGPPTSACPRTCGTANPIKPPGVIPAYVRGGGLMDPKRLTRTYLDPIKNTDKYTYAGQFCQCPTPIGEGMFRRHAGPPHPVRPPARRTRGCGSGTRRQVWRERAAFTAGVKIYRQLRRVPTSRT